MPEYLLIGGWASPARLLNPRTNIQAYFYLSINLSLNCSSVFFRSSYYFLKIYSLRTQNLWDKRIRHDPWPSVVSPQALLERLRFGAFFAQSLPKVYSASQKSGEKWTILLKKSFKNGTLLH